ncbi:MAG TPA: hypothetical protein VGD79_12545 [Thermoanaerobaculia bacterium]|jgi:hypothetical protein
MARRRGWAGGAYFSASPSAAVLPGATLGGFVIESKLPPGSRTAEIRPSTSVWRTILAPLAEGELEPPADSRPYDVKTTTVAPSDPDLSREKKSGGWRRRTPRMR